MNTLILGIESSCDETAAAICKDGKIISNIVATQTIHEHYGGVVPELASRAHQKNIIPVINEALTTAGITSLHKLDAIAYTQGPGLLGALLVGSSFAKACALALNVPVIPVNHMQAHVLAHFIEEPHPEFPFLCLTVSGGHTQIVLVKSFLQMEVIGQSVDDAVGEAFDKCAKLMGIGYPGGPQIDKLAKQGNPKRFSFPHSDMPELSYSFSGIKTAFMYFLKDEKKKNEQFIAENMHDLAASLQHTLIEMLFKKLKKAAQIHKIKNIAIAGGVSANSGLRDYLQEKAEDHGWQVFIPRFEYCTDNAAMIATAGFYHFKEKRFGSLRDSPLPRMTFS